MKTHFKTLSRPQFKECDDRVRALVVEYARRLELPADCLWITTDRSLYSRWLSRRIPSSYGGAYCFLKSRGVHAVLVNLERIDISQPRAVEVVVAEELIHMRGHLDRDYRRHAKHGYDRVAHRVSTLTGASMEEIRSALIPIKRRPYRYVYACPGCGLRVARKRTGRWSCPRCSPRFDAWFVLQVVERMDGDIDRGSA